MTLYGAPFADPLRPWETDEEPWMPADPGPQRGVPLLDVDNPGRWWLVALAVVLLLLGLRAARHPGGTR